MIYTPSEVAGAQQLVDEYHEALGRGEDPPFPQETWNIVQADENARRKAA